LGGGPAGGRARLRGHSPLRCRARHAAPGWRPRMLRSPSFLSKGESAPTTRDSRSRWRPRANPANPFVMTTRASPARQTQQKRPTPNLRRRTRTAKTHGGRRAGSPFKHPPAGRIRPAARLWARAAMRGRGDPCTPDSGEAAPVSWRPLPFATPFSPGAAGPAAIPRGGRLARLRPMPPVVPPPRGAVPLG